jgi:hypothetical protein
MYSNVDLAGCLVWIKEAAADIEYTRIVLAVIAEDDNAVLVDVVSTRQTIRRPLLHTAEAAVAALYICPLVSEAIKGALVDTNSCPILLELFKQADKVLLNLVN